jgi:hypothetical protein
MPLYGRSPTMPLYLRLRSPDHAALRAGMPLSALLDLPVRCLGVGPQIIADRCEIHRQLT